MKIFHIAAILVLGIPSLGGVVRADVVLDWNGAALDAIRSTRTSPPMASRNLAILHGAIYDAVNGIKGKHEKRRLPYLATKHGPKHASPEAAASTAAHQVLIRLWPERTDVFDAAYKAALDAIADRCAKHDGVAYGRYVAACILSARADDGSDREIPYNVPPAPGIWRPHESFGGIVLPALLPAWGRVRPFAIESVEDFRPPPPPALDSLEYAEEVNLIKALGGTNNVLRTEEQTDIAFFWANGAGTATPPGHWNLIARDIVARLGTSLDENARLFALLNFALADAAIVAWDCKYAYKLWRPITAIREAESDGNDATEKDTAWKPLLFTPPFPEYISGHSAFSAAAATVLAGFFGSDDICFTSRSEEYPQIVRTYCSLWHAAVESGYSRLLGGIHFMAGNMRGLDAGMYVGRYVLGNACLSRQQMKKSRKSLSFQDNVHSHKTYY